MSRALRWDSAPGSHNPPSDAYFNMKGTVTRHLPSISSYHFSYYWPSLFTWITCLVLTSIWLCHIWYSTDILKWGYHKWGPQILYASNSHKGWKLGWGCVTSKVVSPTQGLWFGKHSWGPKNLYFWQVHGDPQAAGLGVSFGVPPTYRYPLRGGLSQQIQ